MAKKQKDKVETITEQYKYKGDGELMSDISASKPLKNKKESIIETKIIKEPTQKDIYISMINENRAFTIKINGALVFDSQISNVMLLSFYDTYFRVGTQQYPYEGLNFKFKK